MFMNMKVNFKLCLGLNSNNMLRNVAPIYCPCTGTFITSIGSIYSSEKAAATPASSSISGWLIIFIDRYESFSILTIQSLQISVSRPPQIEFQDLATTHFGKSLSHPCCHLHLVGFCYPFTSFDSIHDPSRLRLVHISGLCFLSPGFDYFIVKALGTFLNVPVSWLVFISILII